MAGPLLARDFEKDRLAAEHEIRKSSGKGWDNESFLFDPDVEEAKIMGKDMEEF